MTFVGRRIGVEGLVYPRGETGRQKREGEGWRKGVWEVGGGAKTCRQTGVWIMEIWIDFFFLCCGRIESSKGNRLQAGWHTGVVLGKCEVRGACSLFLFLSLHLSSLFLPPAPPIPSPRPLRLSMPWSSADATWIVKGREGREGRGRTRERWLKHIFESQEGIFFFFSNGADRWKSVRFLSDLIPKVWWGGGWTQTHTHAHTCWCIHTCTHAYIHTKNDSAS